MDKTTFKTPIVRGSSGGIPLAAQPVRSGFKYQIGQLDRGQSHYHQFLSTLVGARRVYKAFSELPEGSVILCGGERAKESVRKFRPSSNQLQTAKSEAHEYKHTIVAAELKFKFDKVDVVEGNLEENDLMSIYRCAHLERGTEMFCEFSGGAAISPLPPVPIRCVGEPQMIMYLTDDIRRQLVVREKSKIVFARGGAGIFEIKEFAARLSKVVYCHGGRKTVFNRNLVAARPATRTVVLKSINPHSRNPTKMREKAHYDVLHMASPIRAHRIIRESLLVPEEAVQKSWLNVDKHLIQQKRHSNFCGIGDVAGIPNRKAVATSRKQASSAPGNVVRFLKQEQLDPSYDGHPSCPRVTRIGERITAEFGRKGMLWPSSPIGLAKERRIHRVPKRDFVPPAYWQGMIEGCI